MGIILYSQDSLKLRAANIRLILADCDGTLTDGGVYYSATGEEMKRFSIRDGMGVQLLREGGIETGIVSGETSESLKRRAEKLAVRHLYLGIRDKEKCLENLLATTGLSPDAIAYIGDDVNDCGIIKRVREHGLTGAPADAVHSLLRSVHFQCTAKGGHGAFREFADWILELRASTGSGNTHSHQRKELACEPLKSALDNAS
jgi:3-deoxy-D-manno-octulosonate 8-phosphate phosphatase (KDO 8-P phosphatase)